MLQAVAPFDVDTFDPQPAFHEGFGVTYGRAHLRKTFRGDIEGEGAVEMLSARAGDGGAGYVALERITGAVHGHSGSFALLHIATMTSDGQWGKWIIVPDSGTQGLSGIRGEGRIEISDDGAHTFFLDYELGN